MCKIHSVDPSCLDLCRNASLWTTCTMWIKYKFHFQHEFSLQLQFALKTVRLTVNDGCEDSHALEVGIAHCLVKDESSKAGNHIISV